MWKIVFALLVLLLQDCSAQTSNINYTCDDEDYSCTSCFNTLAHELLSSSKNQFELQKVFFPPNDSTPVFVAVSYHYFDTCASLDFNGEINVDMNTNMTKIWFWSASIYYLLFSPLKVHQYMSLLFGDPAFRSSNIRLTLPGECYNANDDMMMMLTQRVYYTILYTAVSESVIALSTYGCPCSYSN